jgi:2,3-bisphosphoglycerate-independent phosphoglycerate mutase
MSLRVNLCAVLAGEDDGLIIHSHNGGGVHGEDVRTLMNDLMADRGFAAAMDKSGLSLTVTDTFRHIGVMKTRALDIGALRLTEPHNALFRPVRENLPRLERETDDSEVRELCDVLREIMLLSHDFLRNHPVNQGRAAMGRLPANMLWPWGAATAMALPSFQNLFGHGGSVVSAVPLVWGLAGLAGLKTPRVEGANGELDTNYEGKADAAVAALLTEGADFAAVHIEAPDEMAHAGDLSGKLEAIRNVESRVVARIMESLAQSGEDFRLLIISDHPTLLTTRTHDGGPVPFAIYDSRAAQAQARKFCEAELAGEPIRRGTELMKLLFEL